MHVDFALSSLDEEAEVVGMEDALYFLQGPLSLIVPKSPTKVNSADFFTFILMLIPVSNVALLFRQRLCSMVENPYLHWEMSLLSFCHLSNRLIPLSREHLFLQQNFRLLAFP